MSTSAAAKETLPLTPDHKEAVGQVASTTQIVAVLLLLWGVITAVSGPYSWWVLGAGFFVALLTLIQGVITILLGLVMLAVSSDFKFLCQFPQFSGNHFRNAAKDLTMFHQVQVGLAIVIVLVALVRSFA
jgi:hypothetical protein